MRKLSTKIFAIVFAAVIVNIQTVSAEDLGQSQYQKPIVKITREGAKNPYAYTPIAFAADWENSPNVPDKNVYQVENGDIVISRFYVPDNY